MKNRKCLKCGKGPVKQWVNDFSNYCDFKCGACGYVWHEAVPDVTKIKAKAGSRNGHKKTVKGRRKSRKK